MRDGVSPVDEELYVVRESWAEFVRENISSDPDHGSRVTFESDPLGKPNEWIITYEYGLYGKPLAAIVAFRVRDKAGDSRGSSNYLARKIRATLPKAKEEARI